MSVISKFAASFVSGTNENNLALANFNIDFALLKVEAPVEYKGLQSALSHWRRDNAEQGSLHRTARKLGALFEQIVPPIQTLIETYGRRVSEISTSEKINQQSTAQEGPFTSHVGPDGSSIYAAATSGSSALATHLLACMLARTWSGPEAIAIWVELVAERKKDIIANTDPAQIQGMAARVAAQQDITRAELARWDASARSWLLCGDEVKCFEQTQLRLIIKDSGMWASSLGNTYQNVMDVWVVAMTSLQNLILGMPQKISKGALLLGLSSWHIYPDLNVVSPPTKVAFKDDLVAPGGSITLGLQNADPEDIDGVKWSLALAHLRYYGDPVGISSKGENFRITIDELLFVAFGSMINEWTDCSADIITTANFFEALATFLGESLETSYPWLFIMVKAARALLTTKDDLERSNALSLVAYGKRKAKTFLASAKESPLPALGLSHPILLWQLSNECLPDEPIDVETMVSNLRRLAERCGYKSDECLIEYQLSNGTFEYATAVPYLTSSHKRDRDGSLQLKPAHARWILDENQEDQISSIIKRNEQCYQYKEDHIKREHGHSTRSKLMLEWLHTVPIAFQRSSTVSVRSSGLEGSPVITRLPNNDLREIQSFEPGSSKFGTRFYSVAHCSDKATLFTLQSQFGFDRNSGIVYNEDGENDEDDEDVEDDEDDEDVEDDEDDEDDRDDEDEGGKEDIELDDKEGDAAITDKRLRGNRQVLLLKIEEITDCLISGKLNAHLLRDYLDKPYILISSRTDDINYQPRNIYQGTIYREGLQDCQYASLRALHNATELYKTLPGATISMRVASSQLYRNWNIAPGMAPGSLEARNKWSKLSNPRAVKFANIAFFESGIHIDPDALLPVMAMSSGNSIYVAEALLQEPLQPDQSLRPGYNGIRRIFGNLGRPGIVMLVPPQAPRIRVIDPSLWRLVNHSPFNNKAEDCFSNTSLHLSFTDYEVPLNVSIGAVDAEITMLESLVSAYDQHNWIADLDILGSLSKPEFRRFQAPRCTHDPAQDIIQKQSVASQIGTLSGQTLVSIDNWHELFDPPDNLGIGSVGVFRASGNWQARLAATSISIQLGHKTIVLPSVPLCTVCGAKSLNHIARFGEIMII